MLTVKSDVVKLLCGLYFCKLNKVWFSFLPADKFVIENEKLYFKLINLIRIGNRDILKVFEMGPCFVQHILILFSRVTLCSNFIHSEWDKSKWISVILLMKSVSIFDKLTIDEEYLKFQFSFLITLIINEKLCCE